MPGSHRGGVRVTPAQRKMLQICSELSRHALGWSEIELHFLETSRIPRGLQDKVVDSLREALVKKELVHVDGVPTVLGEVVLREARAA